MARITPAELRDYIETDLSDTSLQTLIDSVDEDIDSIVGENNQRTEMFYNADESEYINTFMPISSIVSITELYPDNPMVLSADDYEINGRRLRRLATGGVSRETWYKYTKVVYQTVQRANIEKRVAIDLCKLSIVYDGRGTVKVGDYSESPLNYEAERNKLLNQLGGRWWA